MLTFNIFLDMFEFKSVILLFVCPLCSMFLSSSLFAFFGLFECFYKIHLNLSIDFLSILLFSLGVVLVIIHFNFPVYLELFCNTYIKCRKYMTIQVYLFSYYLYLSYVLYLYLINLGIQCCKFYFKQSCIF